MARAKNLEEALQHLEELGVVDRYKSPAARKEAPTEFLPLVTSVSTVVRALDFADPLPTQTNMNNIRQYVEQFTNVLKGIADKPDDQHYYQGGNEKAQLQQQLLNLVKEASPGLSVAVALAAPLGVADLKDRITTMESTLADKEEQLEAKATEILESVKAEAAKIISQAQDAAGHVALAQAQQEFSKQKTGYFRKSIGWGVASIMGVLGFAGLLWYFIAHPPPPGGQTPDYIYPTALRGLSLAAGGAIVTTLVRIFRSNLFLYEHSGHRSTIANSLPVFYNSVADEHRALVLTTLVDRISDFGEPGIASKSRETSPQDYTSLSSLLRGNQ